MQDMNHARSTALAFALCVLAAGCTDDRVTLERGPLGPARYEVAVRAEDNEGDLDEEHRATLRVDPRTEGATFALRATGGRLVTADLRILEDGSVDLRRVRGAPVQGSGQTELASLVGQLNPPLPDDPVRLGERWSSTQRITTRALAASLNTELRMVRFRRVASTDAAELVGEVSGRLRVNDPTRVLEGRLGGTTRIVWAVRAGRVVEAETSLNWSLSDGNTVTLDTTVRPN
jgi:hypothetical protein